ncbi:transcription antitermination factor NusB [Flavipsychrobacter stenotrophus]|uniref:Transcription antitermination factor NusB n=1 Tax=Flavipsychrobacter stenotrophus TaxID=2077091 RepID=A0A2S7SQ68_9BACT|nr:transcription antitermination factor NusB [Flavipsychrobacter stenotrophus]PQJ09053.1 transcription antitermination factor NusB [Flavipsychrobacter stenotrophus]
MISRRNIRVKVMQTLYSLASFEKSEVENKLTVARMLNEKLDHVLDVFTVCVLYPIKIAQYAESDSLHRSSKYIRTEEDMNVNVRIATNSYVLKTLEKASFTEKIKKDKLERFIDEEWVKKIYQQLAKSDEYATYLENPQTPAGDKNIIQFIWDKLIMENESMVSTFVDDLPGWEDNSELIIMLMQNFFKNSSKVDFLKLLTPEKKEYAHDLLLAVLDKEAYCLELIEPKLNNWDKERVALIDLLLLRMAVCEFLYFPTIPTKVTINEYIDIAKQYSMPQSGQFVNGVLDNLLKDLVKENMIRKEERTGR